MPSATAKTPQGAQIATAASGEIIAPNFEHPTTPQDIQAIIDDMETFFKSGATRPLTARHRALQTMRTWLTSHEQDILDALHADLGKCTNEAYECELGLVLDEINFMLHHLHTLATPRHAATPLMHFPAKSRIYPEPFGVVAVLAPWNYPIQLSLVPMVDALAAGNCVLVKPSKTAPASGAIIEQMCTEVFDPRYVHCLFNLPNLDDNMLQIRVDYMFFTGSKPVGHKIMHACANNLTPLTLELGGKSPVFVDSSANIERAGQRIAWGKCLNSGQTCVAPDYILCERSQVESLVKSLKKYIHRYFGADALADPTFPHMINKHHFERVCALIDAAGTGASKAKIAEGGGRDTTTLKIQPTIITDVTLDDAVMQEEIFGPVLPIIAWDNLDDALEIARAHDHPLACYIFSNRRRVWRKIIDELPYGGGCVNDCVIHVATNKMGFGGVGASGMGRYHGRAGFDTFSNFKSIVYKGNCLELPMRAAPFEAWKLRAIRMFMH
jgi:aldehyde dehydrogenase (NAD+)